jgi:hypothetical protein
MLPPAETGKLQAVPASRALDASRAALRYGSRSPSSVPTLLGLIVMLIAAALVASSTGRWASTAIVVPSTEVFSASLALTHPQRPLVGATPGESMPAPDCRSFSSVFAALDDSIHDTMGQPLECPHTDPNTGDTLQATSTGLAIFRHESQTATFTDGYRRWAVGTRGVVRWEGETLDPPGPAR